jgi:hypothetical protein
MPLFYFRIIIERQMLRAKKKTYDLKLEGNGIKEQ